MARGEETVPMIDCDIILNAVGGLELDIDCGEREANRKYAYNDGVYDAILEIVKAEELYGKWPKRGKWVATSRFGHGVNVYCTACGREAIGDEHGYTGTPYCPWCGAEMDISRRIDKWKRVDE